HSTYQAPRCDRERAPWRPLWFGSRRLDLAQPERSFPVIRGRAANGSLRASAGVAPHPPHRGPADEANLFGDAEAVPGVVGDVALLRGLEEGADAVLVALVEHAAQDRGADAASLRGGVRPQHREVVVGRLAGMAPLELFPADRDERHP